MSLSNRFHASPKPLSIPTNPVANSSVVPVGGVSTAMNSGAFPSTLPAFPSVQGAAFPGVAVAQPQSFAPGGGALPAFPTSTFGTSGASSFAPTYGTSTATSFAPAYGTSTYTVPAASAFPSVFPAGGATSSFGLQPQQQPAATGQLQFGFGGSSFAMPGAAAQAPVRMLPPASTGISEMDKQMQDEFEKFHKVVGDHKLELDRIASILQARHQHSGDVLQSLSGAIELAEERVLEAKSEHEAIVRSSSSVREDAMENFRCGELALARMRALEQNDSLRLMLPNEFFVRLAAKAETRMKDIELRLNQLERRTQDDGSVGSTADAFQKIVRSQFQGLITLASRAAALSDRMQELREAFLARRKAQGDTLDPFLRADREEEARRAEEEYMQERMYEELLQSQQSKAAQAQTGAAALSAGQQQAPQQQQQQQQPSAFQLPGGQPAQPGQAQQAFTFGGAGAAMPAAGQWQTGASTQFAMPGAAPAQPSSSSKRSSRRSNR